MEKGWQEASEEERIILVEEFFTLAGCFEGTSLLVSKGRPRSKDDKYAHLNIRSDPVYAVYGEKKGGAPKRKKRPKVSLSFGDKPDPEAVEKRKQRVKKTLKCPYCGVRLKKWLVPDNPFCQTWDNDFMYICFNDACPYYVRGWDCLCSEGNRGMSYRLMYNPEKDRCMPVPVPSHMALREGIVEDEK